MKNATRIEKKGKAKDVAATKFHVKESVQSNKGKAPLILDP
jgi:hypothetical protein